MPILTTPKQSAKRTKDAGAASPTKSKQKATRDPQRTSAAILAAARLGRTRLIDNVAVPAA